MSYCTKCGVEVLEGSAFCSACGNKMTAEAAAPMEQTQPENLRQRKKMHCPVCKSRNISPTTEATSHQGMSYRVTKRISVGGANTTNKNYWMCADCGNKFRNIKELETEGRKLKKAILPLFGALTAVFLLFLLIAPELWVMVLFPLLVFGCATLGLWLTLRKMEKELAYLQVNCFD